MCELCVMAQNGGLFSEWERRGNKNNNKSEMEGGKEEKNMKNKWREGLFYNLDLKSFQHCEVSIH